MPDDHCTQCGRPVLPFSTHPRQTTGPYSTREELRDAVVSMLKAGMKGCDVAAKLNLSNTLISRIKHGDRKQTVNGYRVPSGKKLDFVPQEE